MKRRGSVYRRIPRCRGPRGRSVPRVRRAREAPGAGMRRSVPTMAVGRRRGEAVLGAGLALLLGALRVPATCPGVSVRQQLLKEGFHRELVVRVELGARGEDAGGCTVAARIHLPPGIFVDPYELASLQQHNLTKAVLTPDAIDVEAPEYLSTELHVLLSLEPDLQCSHCFQAALPVHGRYHRPAEERQEAWVVVQSPEALLCCSDNLPPSECWTLSAAEGAPCSGQTPGPCRWYRVRQKSSPEELVLQVPVGLRHQSSLVCVLTLLATVLCSCLVLAAVCRHGHLSPGPCSE